MQNKIVKFTEMLNDELYKSFENPREEYKIVFDSMKYSVSNGGKRVRPLLTLLFCDACGGDVTKALPLAVAIEYIHTYSLIHDDLPSMDNDDFRRGKLSNHKVFGEAYALLSGDGLLTLAFEKIAEGFKNGCYDSTIAVNAVDVLSRFSGVNGMIGGQVIDLSNENNPQADTDTLMLMDKLKTGALIKAACVLGCIAAGADDQKIAAASEFAEKIGLAFQIQDDILDVTSSLEKLGKLTGSDVQNGKSTYVTLLGIDECRKIVNELTTQANFQLDKLQNNKTLKEFSEYLAQREN